MSVEEILRAAFWQGLKEYRLEVEADPAGMVLIVLKPADVVHGDRIFVVRGNTLVPAVSPNAE